MACRTPALSILFALATTGSASSGGEAGAYKKYTSSSTHGSEAGNNYQQQYTQKYAGNFTKYMSSGDQGKSGNLPTFAKDIVGQRAAGFKGYMDEPDAQKNTTASGVKQSPASGAEQSQSGSYQQYMDRYAADYQKYTHQGGQQSQSGGYQQYMNQYAGGYMPSMGTGGRPGAVTLAASPASAQPADYEQYVKQYAADYQEYMGQGGPQQQAGGYQGYMDRYAGDYKKYMHQGGKQSQSSGYQQYMKQYAGDYAQSSAPQGAPGAASLVELPSSAHPVDYGHYVKQYAGDQQNFVKSGDRQAQGAGYSQYMKRYAGSSQQGAGAQGADYEHYMKAYAGDYQKYMNPGGATQLSDANFSQGGAFEHFPGGYVPHLQNSSDSQDWAAHYMKGYANEYQKFADQHQQQLVAQNVTQEQALGGKGEAYVDKYAAGYAHYAHAQAGGSGAPVAARESHSLSDLKAWRAAKLAQLRSYVPEAYRASAEGSVESEFHSNEARIEKEQAAEKSETRKVGEAVPGSAEPQAAHVSDASGEQAAATQHEPSALVAPAQFASQGASEEQAVELTEAEQRIHVDRSVASVALLAAIGALFAALAMGARQQQSLRTPEGYVTMAEP